MMTENKDMLKHSELAESRIRHSSTSPLSATSWNWLEVGDIMNKDVATVNPGISVVSAAKIMSDKNISCIVVLDNGKLAGIITETDLLKRAVAEGNDFRRMTIENIMTTPVRSLARNISVLDASKIMEAENIRRLVILEDEQLVGIITQTDIVRVLTSYRMWKNVEELMTSDVATVSSMATVKEAADLMAFRDVSCLVAIDNNIVEGIFTERDLLKRVIALKRNPYETFLKNVMSSPVMSVPPSYSITSASKTMETKKIRRLLVMNDQNLLGVVTQTDILKAIKGKLQEEEENYIELLNKSRNCIYIVDLNNNTIYANPALMKLLEVTNADELINKPFLPERFWDNPEKRKDILDQLRKASVEVHDLTLKTTSGKKLFITLFSTRTKNIKGQTCGSQGVLYDITAKNELVSLRKAEEALHKAHEELEIRVEQRTAELEQANDILKSEIAEHKRADEQIKEQNEFLNLVIESLTHPFYVIDANDYSIKMANSAANLNTTPEGLTCYKHSHKIDKPCTNPEHRCPLIEIKRTKQPVIVEHKHYDREGNLRLTEVHAYPVFDKQGNIIQMIEYSLDITERKQNERTLEKLNKDLQSTIHELKRTNMELQEFSYITAHDLKTPLRGIGTLAEWLLMDYIDKFDEQGQKQVKMLVRRAKRADKLVESILQYTRAGQSIEENERIDLNTTLPELIREIDPSENIEIIIDDKLPVLICKKTHIRQIFENLIRNAIQYMDKEKGKITVGCVEENNFWKFRITDNGPGIEHKYHKKIFKIFQTLSPPDETDSTGIGLSVVKKIVRLNGGRTWVESNAGEGSTFYFTLPKQEIEVSDERIEANISC
jgi:PAS domain S-box-containing protein